MSYKRSCVFLDLDTNAPDNFSTAKNDYGYVPHPRPEHVLCRNKFGEVTASYGDEVWDFRPYRTTLSVSAIFKFPAEYHCVEQMKWFLFLIFYYSERGGSQKKNVSTVQGKYYFFKSVSIFCKEKGVTMFEFFSDQKMMMLYVKKYNGNHHNLRAVSYTHLTLPTIYSV